jgi:hypothetical protein
MKMKNLNQKNRDQTARQRAARAANPEKFRAYLRRWRAANREKDHRYCAEWAQRNPEKVTARVRRWQLANPERFKEQRRRYRAAALARKAAAAIALPLGSHAPARGPAA